MIVSVRKSPLGSSNPQLLSEAFTCGVRLGGVGWSGVEVGWGSRVGLGWGGWDGARRGGVRGGWVRWARAVPVLLPMGVTYHRFTDKDGGALLT